MRAPLFFAVAALAATCSLAFSKEEKIGPSDSQMESAFTRYLYGDSATKNSKIEFVSFKKDSCKPILVAPGLNCAFTYVAKAPLDLRNTALAHLSRLPAGGRLAGRFFTDENGQLRFEMIIG